MVHQLKPSELFFFKDKNFRGVIIFLSGMQWKNPSRQMRSHTHMLQMQIRRDEHGTHKHAHGSWILRSVSRVRSKTMHSLFCITS